MNKLDLKKRAQVLSCLVEGNSIRATVRMTGLAKNTVVKLLADVGSACAAYQDKALRKLPCKSLQCNEIWSFVYAKAKNVAAAKAAPEGAGDAWTWTAICADTKLVACWMIGPRDAGVAHDFMRDLASRLAGRVQITTDGFRSYIDATGEAFNWHVDYAQLVKLYGEAKAKTPERKYSAENLRGIRIRVVSGDPDPAHISTSDVERQNLTMRMSMRRFTRLTNGFSKKLENLGHAVALHFMHYNFARIHQMPARLSRNGSRDNQSPVVAGRNRSSGGFKLSHYPGLHYLHYFRKSGQSQFRSDVASHTENPCEMGTVPFS